MWRCLDERYADCCVRQVPRWRGESVSGCAANAGTHKTPLIIIDGYLIARRYMDEVFQPTVLPFLQNYTDVTTFQYDNAGPLLQQTYFRLFSRKQSRR